MFFLPHGSIEQLEMCSSAALYISASVCHNCTTHGQQANGSLNACGKWSQFSQIRNGLSFTIQLVPTKTSGNSANFNTIHYTGVANTFQWSFWLVVFILAKGIRRGTSFSITTNHLQRTMSHSLVVHDTEWSLAHVYPTDSIRKEERLCTGQVPSCQSSPKHHIWCATWRDLTDEVVIYLPSYAEVWQWWRDCHAA